MCATLDNGVDHEGERHCIVFDVDGPPSVEKDFPLELFVVRNQTALLTLNGWHQLILQEVFR